MSLPRPNFIDLNRSTSQISVSRPLRSPRLHVAGEAPPELSPLDAFAMQSRLLARQLEESQKSDRRISRLPPLTTESPLIVQGRSEYFRSFSQDSGSEPGELPALEHVGLGMNPNVEEGLERPKSMHPRMSRIPPTPDEPVPFFRPGMENMAINAARGRQLGDIDEADSFFGVDARRERSPSPMDIVVAPEKEPTLGAHDGAAVPSIQSSQAPASPDRGPKKNSVESTGLVPPRAVFPKRSSSIMSSPLESTDEEALSSLGTSYHSQEPRKYSTSSGMISPSFAPYRRSPSVSSDASGFPRPSLNFSRPMSRAGTPGLETPARQTSEDSHTSFVLADDSACTPISMNSEAFPEYTEDGKAAAPSYIYSRFSLPRGKVLQRNSVLFLGNQAPAQFQWEQPPIVPPSNVQTFPLSGQAPPSPPTRPASSAESRTLEEPVPAPVLEPTKLSSEEVAIPVPVPQSPSGNSHVSAEESSQQLEESPEWRPQTAPSQEAMRGRPPISTTTSDTASTIKPSRSLHSKAPTVSDMTAEEHLTKGIALHENGSLNESTYHLRHAARQGHPTGMLLYALACRHGWGMRQNPREGVEWLRKAAESASLEIADNEDQEKEGKPVTDVVERKTRKAQFALSIYELGVSHMNGWGIEQDKVLALRCFEIAGAWGDIDALAEAGFCYAQGVGCKKNLKKSAYFYRQAEAKGMSMVGNSWIHKSKYNEDESNSPDKKRARSKSKTRKSLFHKKANAP